MKIYVCSLIILAMSFSCFVFAQSPVYIGPGGGGVVTFVNEKNGELVVGTDVAGMFVGSRLGGFVPFATSIPSRFIMSLDRAENTTGEQIIVGTSSGAFKSTDGGAIWVEMTANLPDASSLSVDKWEGLKRPVHEVAFDKNNSSIIYIGMGIGNKMYPWPFESSFHIYQSTDEGTSWNGILKFTGAASGATVYQIYLPASGCTTSSDKCQKIFVSTDKGLYYSDNAGNRWFSLGINPIRVTVDKGDTWSDCNATICPTEFTSPCTIGQCLPLASNAGEAVPNTRRIVEARDPSNGSVSLYTNLYDTGYLAETDSRCSSVDYYSDLDASDAISGIYRSLDNGVNWSRVEGASSKLPKTIRCGTTSGTGLTTHNTIYVDFSVDEANPEHLVTYSIGPKSGIFERVDGNWRRIDGDGYSSWGVSSVCEDGACVEGGRRGGLYHEELPSLSAGFHSGQFTTLGKLYLGHTRGGMEISWPRRSSYPVSIKHLHQKYLTVTESWKSTGVDNVCSDAGVFEVGPPTERRLLYGIYDYGFLLSNDSGKTWEFPSDINNIPFGSSRISSQVLVDPAARAIYSVLREGNDSTNSSIQMSLDNGHSWQSIGGACDRDSASECTAVNGLAQETVSRHLAIDYSTPATSRGLFLATSTGISRYSHEGTTSEWISLDLSSCGLSSPNVKNVLTIPEYPQLAFFSVNDDNAYGTSTFSTDRFIYSKNEGVYFLSWTSSPDSINCGRLIANRTGEVLPYNPEFLTYGLRDGQIFLLAASTWNGWPSVHGIQFSPTSLSEIDGKWAMLLDIYYEINSATGAVKSRTNSLIKGVNDNFRLYLEAEGSAYQESFQKPENASLSIGTIYYTKSDGNFIVTLAEDKNQHKSYSPHVLSLNNWGESVTVNENFELSPYKTISTFSGNSRREFIGATGCQSAWKW